jgi:hypothetical protein
MVSAARDPVRSGWQRRARAAISVGRYQSQIESFSKIWQGGYWEGDPLDPLHPSTYRSRGYLSTLHVVYLMCVKPYVSTDTAVLEIGPGRGAWTKTFVSLGAKEIWALDAASAAHTHFHEYVGRHPNVHYVQVEDCRLEEVPDDSIDFFFTFGVFCHLPNEMVGEYIAHLAHKMRPGATGFMMIGDFTKYNACADAPDVLERLFSLRVYAAHRLLHRLARRLRPGWFALRRFDVASGVATQGDEGLGGWFHLSIDRACEMLEGAGFTVESRDVGANLRDPIIHFRK